MSEYRIRIRHHPELDPDHWVWTVIIDGSEAYSSTAPLESDAISYAEAWVDEDAARRRRDSDGYTYTYMPTRIDWQPYV